MPELLRYIVGPLPGIVCFCHLWLKNVVFSNGILIYDGIILTNYIFIFWLKNPAAFRDDFWNIFINSWIICFSFVTQLIFMWTPGNQPLNFFLCTGTYPNVNNPKKINYVLVIAQVLSVTLHIVLSLKIQRHKRKISDQLSGHSLTKAKFLSDIEKGALINFALNFMNVVLLGLSGIVISEANNLNPIEVNIYPNYLYMYICHLVAPLCICFSRCAD